MNQRVEELTARVHSWITRPIRAVVLLIVLYYGGSAYGNSRYISRPLWQDAILWPIAILGFATIIADDIGRKGRKLKLSRWLAGKLVQRQERKGAYLPPDPEAPLPPP